MNRSMNENEARTLIESFSQKQQGGHFACPRCGHMRMNAEGITRNALTRAEADRLTSARSRAMPLMVSRAIPCQRAQSLSSYPSETHGIFKED